MQGSTSLKTCAETHGISLFAQGSKVIETKLRSGILAKTPQSTCKSNHTPRRSSKNDVKKMKRQHCQERFHDKFRHSPCILTALADEEVLKQETTARFLRSTRGHVQNNMQESCTRNATPLKKYPITIFNSFSRIPFYIIHPTVSECCTLRLPTPLLPLKSTLTAIHPGSAPW